MDLRYVLVEAVDRNGNLCPDAHHQVEIDIKGTGYIAGVGNGNPQSTDPFQSNRVKLFYGKAMVILRAGFEKGKVGVSVHSKYLESNTVVIDIAAGVMAPR